jgi:hypothetical protein
MKFQVMEYRGPETDVIVLGAIEAETTGAAIRRGIQLWSQLHADNYFIKEKNWTTWVPKATAPKVNPISSAPLDDPYG